jgi:hypothetical protein
MLLFISRIVRTGRMDMELVWDECRIWIVRINQTKLVRLDFDEDVLEEHNALESAVVIRRSWNAKSKHTSSVVLVMARMS